MTTKNAPMIYQKISEIMAEIGPIGKDKKNVQQGYQFRGIDDVYNALQPILAKHKVFTTSEILSEKSEEKATKSGSVIFYRIYRIRWTFYAEDGSSVTTETIGEGMDSGDKGSNKAMSVAHKYALLQVFCIPTEESKDPEMEEERHEIVPAPEAAKGLPVAAGTFTGTDEQKKALEKTLKKWKVPEESWSSVWEKMMDKPSTYIFQLVKEF